MNIHDITLKMIDYSDGNLHDIAHFMKVHAYAHLIAEGEHVDEQTKQIVEIAALVHDIACPLCRQKYGNTNGKYQEAEGMPLTREFLSDTGLDSSIIERITYLVGHHHTYTNADAIDLRILLEADYLVNAHESSYSLENIQNAKSVIFKTRTGIQLLTTMYLKPHEHTRNGEDHADQ